MSFHKLLLCALLSALPASGSLILTLSPAANSSPGSTVTFSGTLLDTDGDNSYLFLNDISVAFDPPGDTYLTATDTYFLNTVPGDLIGDADPNDNSYAGGIFQVDIASNTPLGVYTGTATILGGYNGPFADYNALATQTFQVVVSPEPLTAGLMLLPLVGFVLASRRRTA